MTTSCAKKLKPRLMLGWAPEAVTEGLRPRPQQTALVWSGGYHPQQPPHPTQPNPTLSLPASPAPFPEAMQGEEKRCTDTSASQRDSSGTERCSGGRARCSEPEEPVPIPRLSQGHPTMWSGSLHLICICRAPFHPSWVCIVLLDCAAFAAGTASYCIYSMPKSEIAP